MGITFHPTDNTANVHEVRSAIERNTTAHFLLQNSYDSVYGNGAFKWPPLYSSSFSTSLPRDSKFVAVNNGLLDTVLRAYSYHHHLVIRPDDLWLAILTQFSLFVNANSESLRSSFVSHAGKETLSVLVTGRMDSDGLSSIPVNMVSSQLIEAAHQRIVDPSILEWIIPNFTTTETRDRTVAAIVMLSAFKSYFNYEMYTKCGLPSVTLEGEKSDYQSILRRIEKLTEYGPYSTAWYHLLRPVLKRLVRSFDDPESDENKTFWNTAINKNGSGRVSISGWITAFCLFDKEGKWLGPQINLQPGTPELDHPSSIEHVTPPNNPVVLDDIHYPTIILDKIAPGCVEVDVIIKVGGPGGAAHPACLMAGLCGYRVLSSNGSDDDQGGRWDTLRPISGWWMYEKAN